MTLKDEVYSSSQHLFIEHLLHARHCHSSKKNSSCGASVWIRSDIIGHRLLVPVCKVYFEQIFGGRWYKGRDCSPLRVTCAHKEGNDAEWRSVKAVSNTLCVHISLAASSWSQSSTLPGPRLPLVLNCLPGGHCETWVGNQPHLGGAGQGGAKNRTGHSADVSMQKANRAHTY